MFENGRLGSEEPDRLDNDSVRHCTQMFSDSFAGAEPTKGWSVQYKISIIQEKTKTNHAIHYLFTDAYHLAIHLCTVNRYEDA